MKLVLPILFLAVILVGCEIEKVIDYDTYYGGDKIVVHAYLSESAGLLAGVQKTVPPDNPHTENRIDDARVFLLADGKRMAEAESSDGRIYTIAHERLVLDYSTRYSVEVQSKKLGTVFSDEMTLPHVVSIDSLHVVDHHVQICFHNPSAETAYILHRHEYLDGRDSYTPMFYFIGYYNDGFPIGSCYLDSSTGWFADSIGYELIVVGPELKAIIDSREEYNYSFGDVFYEYTYPIETNIHNGYGLFGTYSSSTKMWINQETVDFWRIE